MGKRERGGGRRDESVSRLESLSRGNKTSGPAPRSLRRTSRIYTDPVITHLGPFPFSFDRRDDRVRSLLRHVTVDAPSRERVSDFRKESATLLAMTRHAAAGELDRVPLGAVHVMTRGTRHLRIAEAGAAREQRHLIAVHVDLG